MLAQVSFFLKGEYTYLRVDKISALIYYSAMSSQKILILDFGSQYTQLIARRVREANVYCEILPCFSSYEEHFSEDIAGLILSGGPASVIGDDRPEFDAKWLESDLPILGVCYGMQLLAKRLGGSVGSSEKREYGHAS